MATARSAGEQPVHDYAGAHESFGWRSRAASARRTVHSRPTSPTPPGAPILDLFFDTSGHGTHVSGIAAGHDIYGVAGFDGVAPGAQLLGLKIANDAHGRSRVTGSMVRAMDYAIRFADRHLPLVLNMSFGVGNEVEGTARIDALIDSILAAHPDVVMASPAGTTDPASHARVSRAAPRAYSRWVPRSPRSSPARAATVPRAGSGRAILQPRWRNRQAGHRRPGRGVFHRAAVRRGRGTGEGHQHGRALRGRSRRAAGVGTVAQRRSPDAPG